MSLKIGIDRAVFDAFPGARVGFMLLDVEIFSGKDVPKPQEKFLSALKQETVQKIRERGITPDNYLEQRVCQSWEKVFLSMQAPEGRHSTIIGLLQRAAKETLKLEAGKKADLGKISNFVDTYNCASIQTLTPMGALHVPAIQGSVSLRYGRAGETFLGLGRDMQEERVESSHIVYADEHRILTNLWNYRDAAHVAVPNKGHTYVLLFADQAEEAAGDVKEALVTAARLLEEIGAKVLGGIYELNAAHPEQELNVPLEAISQGVKEL